MHRLIALLCLFLIVLLPQPTLAAAPAARILEAGGGLALALTTPAPTFAFLLTLEETAGISSPAPVQMILGPLARVDGQPLAGASLQLTQPSGVGLGAVTLRAGELAPFQLRGELPEPGVYRAALTLRSGIDQAVYTVSITRSAPADLLVSGAASTGLVLSSSTTEYQAVVMLRLADGQPGLTDLRLALDPLRRPDGLALNDATLTCDACAAAPLVLAAGQDLPITIKAHLLEPGEYRSALRLSLPGRVQVVPLTLTRLAHPKHIEITLTTPLNVTRRLRDGGQGQAGLALELVETGGRPGLLFPPEVRLMSLAAKNGSTGGFVPQQNGHLMTGFPPSPSQITRGPGSGEISISHALLPISAYETLRYELVLPELDHAGTYTGTVVTGGPESARVSAPIELRVRDHWLWVLLVIGLGVVISFGLMILARSVRPWISLAHDAAALREQIAGGTLPSGDRLGLFFDRRLEQIGGGSIGERVKNLAALEDLRLRYTLYRRALALDGSAREGLGSQWHPALDRLIDAVRGSLAVEETLDPDAVKAVLETYKQGLLDLEKKALLQPARDLLAALDEIGREAPDLKKDADGLATGLNQQMVTAANDPDAFRIYLARTTLAMLGLQVRRWREVLRQMELERRRSASPQAEAWQPVIAKIKAASESLDTLEQAVGQVDHPAAETAASEVQRRCLDANHAHLEVMVSPEGRPFSVEPQQWIELAAGYPGLSGWLSAARAALNRSLWSEASRWLGQVRGALLNMHIHILRQQIPAIRDSLRAAWQAAGAKRLPAQAVLKAEAGLSQPAGMLPEPEAGPEQRAAQYQAARAALLTAWYELLATWTVFAREEAACDTPDAGTICDLLRQAAGLIEQAGLARVSAPAAAEEHARAAHQLLLDILPRLYAVKLTIKGLESVTRSRQASLALLPWSDLLAPPAELVFPALPGGLDRGLLQGLSAARIGSLLTCFDLLLAAWVFVLALGVGYQTLYLPNLTFGGPDYLVALLWGLGSQGGAAGLLGALLAALKKEK